MRLDTRGTSRGSEATATESRGACHGSASTGTLGHPVFHFPFFSPLAIATLIAALGGFGLIGKYGLGLADGASLGVAIPLAFATAYGVTYAAFRLVAGARASSVIRMDQLAGSSAEVTAPIPAGGVGEAVAMVAGQRYAAPAREADGGGVPRGTAVTVVGMVRSDPPRPAGTATRQQGDAKNA